jgi:hypothetical protein
VFWYLQSPVIVKIIRPPSKDPTGISDVIIGALGLTGALFALAVALGVALAGIMFWLRSR